jgi:hypothetical protein
MAGVKTFWTAISVLFTPASAQRDETAVLSDSWFRRLRVSGSFPHMHSTNDASLSVFLLYEEQRDLWRNNDRYFVNDSPHCKN